MMAPDGTVTRGFAILRGGVTDAAATAAGAERLGYHRPGAPVLHRLRRSSAWPPWPRPRLARIGGSIAYAVGRTPLVLATEARSLDELCEAGSSTASAPARPR